MRRLQRWNVLLFSAASLSAALAVIALHVFSLFSVVRIGGSDPAAFSFLYVGGVPMSSGPLVFAACLAEIAARSFYRQRHRGADGYRAPQSVALAYLSCAAVTFAPAPDALHNLGAIGLSCLMSSTVNWCARRFVGLPASSKGAASLLAAGVVSLLLEAPLPTVSLGVVAMVLGGFRGLWHTEVAAGDRSLNPPSPLMGTYAVALLLVVLFAVCACRDDVVSVTHLLMTRRAAHGVLATWLLGAAGTLIATNAVASASMRGLRSDLWLVVMVVPVVYRLLCGGLMWFDHVILYYVLTILLFACEACQVAPESDGDESQRQRVFLLPALVSLVSLARPLLYPQLGIGQTSSAANAFLFVMAAGLAVLVAIGVATCCSNGLRAQRPHVGLVERWGLTSREGAVVRGIVAGDSLRIIAARLGIARATAGTYATRAYRKLGVSDRSAMLELVTAQPVVGMGAEEAPCDASHATWTSVSRAPYQLAALESIVRGGVSLLAVWVVLSQTPFGKGDTSGSCMFPVLALGFTVFATAAAEAIPLRGRFTRMARAAVHADLSAGWCAAGVGATASIAALMPDIVPALLLVGCAVVVATSLYAPMPASRIETEPVVCASPVERHQEPRLPLPLAAGLALGGFGAIELLSYPLTLIRPFIVSVAGMMFVTTRLATCILSALIVALATGVALAVRKYNLRFGAVARILGAPCLAGGMFGGGMGISGLLPLTEFQHTLLCVGFMAAGVLSAALAILCLARREARAHATEEELLQRILRTTELTPTEARVALMLARGWSAKHVAQVLVVSPQTVATHRKRIYRKLGIHRQSSLADALDL